MPLFEISDQALKLIKTTNFKLEKAIQDLIEKNIEVVFNSRFIASEYSTGSEHAGRIDTLGLSEDNNPVIIEYKKVESSELINQSLYYLSWIKDHKGDFQVLVNKTFKREINIDRADIRVICIAPWYKKYDIHAVQMMGANIELWQYKLYENNILYFEEIFKKSVSLSSSNGANKNPTMIAAGKKAAITRNKGVYNIKEHEKNLSERLREILKDLRDFIMGLDGSIEEQPKKFYIAYKLTQNFVCLETKQNKMRLYLKIDSKKIDNMPENGRNVSTIGHYWTGDFEYTIKNEKDFEESKKFIELSLKNIGG